jgi:nucleoside-diphosphate-sugar epimerase
LSFPFESPMNLQNKTILITDNTEFVGLRIAQLADQLGVTVRGLARSPQRARDMQNQGIDVRICDYYDADGLANALEGVDIVIHAAQLFMDLDINQYRKSIMGTATAIAEATRKAGIKTFVYLSTVIVYGFKYPKQVTEAHDLRCDAYPHAQAMIDTEAAMQQFNHPPEMGVITLRLGDVYGPGTPACVTMPLQNMRQNQFAMPDGGKGKFNHLYIDNCIDALVLALEKEVYGEIFNITDGCETTCKEYFTRLAQLDNLSAPISMPGLLMRPLVRTMFEQQKRQGNADAMLSMTVDWMSRSNFYSIEKAQRVLGYQPKVSLDEGMRRVQHWLATHPSEFQAAS